MRMACKLGREARGRLLLCKLGICNLRDNREENGNYRNYRGYIGIIGYILEFYRDNGKEN